MKKAPIKILIIVLIAGLVSIFGELVLSTFMNRVSDQHSDIMSEYVENREYMAKISNLVYEHQAMLGHIVENSKLNENNEEYKKREKELRGELSDLMVEFSYRMKVGRDEQLFHKVYSNFCSYQLNVNKLLQFCEENSMDMAVYYYNEVLVSFLDGIDSNLAELDAYTERQIKDAQNKMNVQINNSRIVGILCVFSVIVLTMFSVFYCVSITTGLDKYKGFLEKELETKNRDLRAHTEKIMKLQDGIIIGMANLIENRDGDTGEHVKRTSAYVSMLAKKARENNIYKEILTDAFIERLVKAAPLHDVGKIAIPDSILMKPGKLTEEEFEIMKTHAPEGGRVIKEIFENLEDREFVDMAVDIATYHHEKWDGKGYMKHLQGEEIPLSARIMALADVFDALISKRCYKDEYSLDEAFKIIKESTGTHFDPKLGEIFVEMRPEIETYLNENK